MIRIITFKEIHVDYVIDLLVTWWQFTILGILIIIGFIVNKLDNRNKNEVRVGFMYTEMPVLRPLPIKTKDKGFWGAIWLWLLGVRHWRLDQDFEFSINGNSYVIPKGFEFDGASVPKFLATFLSPVGVLLMGGLIHDYMYKYEMLLRSDKRGTSEALTQKQADQIFRDINIEVNGFYVLNYLAYWALRIGGFVAWNGHRKRNCKIEI